jgi:sigma-B regulation protein RsbU (phosphoserine phosphatase)
MADRLIRIKTFSHGATGSLARRVLYGSLALLGLPLIVHTFFLYHREYDESVKSAFQSLSYLAEGRVLYLEHMIRNQERLLNVLVDEIPQSPEARRMFLEQEAQKSGVTQLLYVELDNGEPVCDDSLCQDPSFLPYLQDAAKRENYAFVNPYAKEKYYRFFVGKTIPSSGNPKALFFIATKSSRILKYMTEVGNSPLPLRISLLDESGKIFLSTKQWFVGKKVAKATCTISCIPYKDVQNAWFLKMEGETYLAIKSPIRGTDYTLLVDIPERSISKLQLKNYFYRIGSFILIVCLLGGAIVFWFTHRISKPLRSLGAAMQRIADGATHVRFKPDPMGFEINAIGVQLNQMLDSLIAHQQEAERERISRERLAQELKIGHEIQAGMFPIQFPDTPSLDIAPGYLPAREVSGDFYDLFPLDNSRILIAIADAADKGISACLYSLSFRSMLRTAAVTKGDLATIVKTANTLLMHDTAESNFFITAWIAIYDLNTKSLQYCSQGHPPAYLRNAKGNLEALSTSGMALGVVEVEPEIQLRKLQKNDLLFLYTDGVIEAHDSDRQLFGKARLKEYLERSKAASSQAVVDQLMEEIHLFCSGAPQADDLTLLSIIQK